MSLSNEETLLLEKLAVQVASLRQEIASYEGRVSSLVEQNAQLSGQISALNTENERLSKWVATVSQQVKAYHEEGIASEKRLVGLVKQLAAELK